jgi:beta-glucanase (GH16 family)
MAASGARRFGGRLATVAVLSGLLLPFGSGLPGDSPGVAQAAPGRSAAVPLAVPVAVPLSVVKPKKKGSSWKIVRTVDFNGSALPTGCSAYTGKYTAGSSAWIAKDAVVSKSSLKLKLEKRKTGGKPYSSGGLACLDWKQAYGRYEIVAKVPKGKGIDSTIALWPTNPKQAAWTGLELLAPGPDTAYVTNGYSTKFERAQVPGSYAGAYHTYVIETSPNQVRMTVDGKQIYYSTHSFGGSRWFAITVSNGDALTGVPDATTVLPAQLQVDRVKVYSYTGVPPKAQPTPTVTATASASPGTGTPGPTVSGSSAAPRLPGASPTGTAALAPVSADSPNPALAGGIWPWLLGGSLIAATVIIGLNYSRSRRDDEAGTPQ